MESVKIAGMATHNPAMYSGARPPGPHLSHTVIPSTVCKAISPPAVNRPPAGGYSYLTGTEDHPAVAPSAARYVQGSPYVPIYGDSPYMRPVNERPILAPEYRRPTILAPGYRQGPYGRDMGQMVAGVPHAVNTTSDASKRMKLQPPKPELRVPLVIDTSESCHTNRESTYNPQVEAISPTLPSDPRDESPLRSTKDDLLKQIDQVDREIAKAESNIAKLRKKESELEVAARRGVEGGVKAEEEEVKEGRSQSVAQVIYAENRKKAEESHTMLTKLVQMSDISSVLPLYHQPSDTEMYLENKRKYATFKRRLLEYFKKRNASRILHDRQITQTYSKLVAEWMKKVEKVENSKKHKEKVAKGRELFEKVFPELRKHREEKERLSRVGARVKSDAEMEEVMDGLQEQENEDHKMRAYAVIPPILQDERKRKHRYESRNGLIDDPLAEYSDRKTTNIWSSAEREIFRDKYLQHPKNFAAVASYLERKGVADCVLYYYATKKIEGYKMLVKRRIRRPRKGGPVPTAAQIVEVIGVNATGVTTRGSVAALQQQQQLRGGNGSSSGPSIMRRSPQDGTLEVVNGGSNGPLTRGGQFAAPLPALVGNHPMEGVSIGQDSRSDAPLAPASPLPELSAILADKDKENVYMNSDKSLRRERSRKDGEKMEESSDEEVSEGKGEPHACVLCGIHLEHYGLSRRVSPGQAGQYGLKEDQLGTNTRVCTTCRCRSVRRRVMQCPLPLCPTPKWRVKRLRPFPSRWSELPAEEHSAITRELQIPDDVTKCCSACHNRISRRLGSESEDAAESVRWSEEEVENLREALKEVGCHWTRVCERVNNKTEGQCKNFYFNFKKKYHLDEVVAEYRRARGKSDGPPTVTDEEESGSSTSSCDEGGVTLPPPGTRHDSASDTTSAPSPGLVLAEDKSVVPPNRDEVLPVQPSNHGTREDYDSSTTASADESQGGQGGRDSPPEVQHIPHPGERCLSNPSTGVASVAPGAPGYNVREVIFKTIEDSLKKTGPPPPSTSPTISSILERNSYPRPVANPIGVVAPSTTPEYRGDNHTIPNRYSDPRAGLPLPIVDVPCEGLDLTVRRRERSPPPPIREPSRGERPREIPYAMVKGGAELTITSAKELPPHAHAHPSLPGYCKPHDSDRSWNDEMQRSKAVAAYAQQQQQTHSRLMEQHAVVYQRSPLPPTQSGKQPGDRSNPPISLARVQQQPVSSASRFPMVNSRQDKLPVGSITQGTPMNSQGGPPGSLPLHLSHLSQAGRYDMMPKLGAGGKEGGSITQGTPMQSDHKPRLIKDNSVMNEPRPGSGVEIIPRPPIPHHLQGYDRTGRPLPPPPHSTGYPFSGQYPTANKPYPDHLNSTRETLASDYETSRQMQIKLYGEAAASRASPRGGSREAQHSPQRDMRERVLNVVNQHNQQQMERRGPIDPRGVSIDMRLVDPRPQDPRQPMYYAYPPHPGQPPPHHMHHHALYMAATDPRGVNMRNSADPRGGIRDTAPSPQDFRSPGVSTPTPPPSRQSTVIRRPPGKPTASPHLVPPKSSSPRSSEGDRYSPRIGVTPVNNNSDALNTLVDTALAQQRWQSNLDLDHRRLQMPMDSRQIEGFEKQFTDSMRVGSGGGSRQQPIMDLREREHRERGEQHHQYLDQHQQQRGGNTYERLKEDHHRSGLYHTKEDFQRISYPSKDDLQRMNYSSKDEIQRSNYPSKEDLQRSSYPLKEELQRSYSTKEESPSRHHLYPPNISSTKTGPPPLSKEDAETDAAQVVAACFQKDAVASSRSSAQHPPGSKSCPVNSGDMLTASNLIDAIITHQINNSNPPDKAPPLTDSRGYRHEGDPGSGTAMEERRGGYLGKEVNDYLPPPTNHHKGAEGLGASLHAVTLKQQQSHLHSGTSLTPKSLQAHMDSIINREFADGHKLVRPPLEIIRTDGIRQPTSMTTAPPSMASVVVSQIGSTGHSMDHWKQMERKQLLSPQQSHAHRQASVTNLTGHGAPPTSHLAPDERQIIRIAQPPISPRGCEPQQKILRLSPPHSSYGGVEPISPPNNLSRQAPSGPTPDSSNHVDGRFWGGPPRESKEVFDYVRVKIAEVMRTSESREEAEKRSPFATASQQSPAAQQFSNHDQVEESARKRPRLEESRPPSQPRSGEVSRRDASPSGGLRDEVADSPQSGEMVIDESPRGAPSGEIGNSRGADMGPPKSVNNDKREDQSPRTPQSGPYPSYPYSFPNQQPSEPSIRTQNNAPSAGYEPHVEPVSDED